MGNFKSLAKNINTHTKVSRRRSILRGSVGPDGENRPADLRLISRALSESGLLSADASNDQVKHAITRALRHIHRTANKHNQLGSGALCISPADNTERVMRRSIAELRFPTAHRAIALSTAPKGARALVECGMSIARNKLHQGAFNQDTPAPFRRAMLPPLPPQSYQSNRHLAETFAKFDLEGLDILIAESISDGGKAGFVEVRDFFSVLRAKDAYKTRQLGAKTKRHLREKPRRRFIKLLQEVPPNEDDFDDSAS